MSPGSLAPLTFCGRPTGLVGSQFLDESQIRWSSAGSATEARHAQSLTKIGEHCPCRSISGLSSKRQALVESEFLPEICNPMPDASSGTLADVSGSWHEWLRELTPARWQRGGQRNR